MVARLQQQTVAAVPLRRVQEWPGPTSQGLQAPDPAMAAALPVGRLLRSWTCVMMQAHWIHQCPLEGTNTNVLVRCQPPGLPYAAALGARCSSRVSCWPGSVPTWYLGMPPVRGPLLLQPAGSCLSSACPRVHVLPSSSAAYADAQADASSNRTGGPSRHVGIRQKLYC